jgi:hypothetical protein
MTKIKKNTPPFTTTVVPDFWQRYKDTNIKTTFYCTSTYARNHLRTGYPAYAGKNRFYGGERDDVGHVIHNPLTYRISGLCQKNPVCDSEGGDIEQVIHLPMGYLAYVGKNRFWDGEGGYVRQHNPLTYRISGLCQKKPVL